MLSALDRLFKLGLLLLGALFSLLFGFFALAVGGVHELLLLLLQ